MCENKTGGAFGSARFSEFSVDRNLGLDFGAGVAVDLEANGDFDDLRSSPGHSGLLRLAS